MMYSDSTSIRVEQNVIRDSVDVYIIHRQGAAKSFATSVELAEFDEHAVIPPVFVLGPSEAQQLMDDLWRAGVRPTEGSGSAGSLAATERHLKDLQRLVFEGGAR